MMLENFRYASSWEDFEETVKKIKELLKAKQAYWLLGFMKDLGLGIDDAASGEVEGKVRVILQEEILYFIYYGLKGIEIRDTDIREAIADSKNKVSDAELKKLIMLVQNKFELVKDAFEIDKLRTRYNIKKNSVNLKLSDIEYNVMSQNMPNGNSVHCILVNMACKKKLRNFGTEGIAALIEEKEPTTEFTFICDEDDIDILISQLIEIKQKIKESYNDGDSKKNR